MAMLVSGRVDVNVFWGVVFWAPCFSHPRLIIQLGPQPQDLAIEPHEDCGAPLKAEKEPKRVFPKIVVPQNGW